MVTKVSNTITKQLPVLTRSSVAPEGDFFVKLADEALESFSVGGEPGRFLVDFFPLCASPHLRFSV